MKYLIRKFQKVKIDFNGEIYKISIPELCAIPGIDVIKEENPKLERKLINLLERSIESFDFSVRRLKEILSNSRFEGTMTERDIQISLDYYANYSRSIDDYYWLLYDSLRTDSIRNELSQLITFNHPDIRDKEVEVKCKQNAELIDKLINFLFKMIYFYSSLGSTEPDLNIPIVNNTSSLQLVLNGELISSRKDDDG